MAAVSSGAATAVGSLIGQVLSPTQLVADAGPIAVAVGLVLIPLVIAPKYGMRVLGWLRGAVGI